MLPRFVAWDLVKLRTSTAVVVLAFFFFFEWGQDKFLGGKDVEMGAKICYFYAGIVNCGQI